MADVLPWFAVTSYGNKRTFSIEGLDKAICILQASIETDGSLLIVIKEKIRTVILEGEKT